MKKLPVKRQKKVIQLFNNLFSSGFNLSEIVDFLKKASLLEAVYTDRMTAGLLKGLTFSAIMGELGFSDDVVTQLSLADSHGDTQSSLLKIEGYLTNLIQVRKRLIEVATYPIILLFFLVLIMLGLRNYLLPQLEKGNLATQLISYFPNLFLGACLLIGLLSGLVYLVSKRLPRLVWYGKLARLPILGQYVRLYFTAYYAREWGNLIGQGLEMLQIVQLMQRQKSQLFREIGHDMEKSLLAGQHFYDKVLEYPFFRKELSLMIEYGQVKSKLGSELAVYAEESWEAFFAKVTKATQLIQPIIFIIVALVIVMIYAAMLLPMYQNMEVVL